MKKSEIFDVILAKICDECEVKAEDIISGCKDQTVVDARTLLVQYVRRTGISNSEIARIVLNKRGIEEPCPDSVRRKAKVVDNIFRSYSDRCLQSRAFCLMSRGICQFYDSTFMTHTVG